MKQILIFTGAGLSAESGISTFRDSGGLWENHNPMQIANISTFDSNRELVFDFYNKRRAELEFAQPNAAHLGIAELQQDFGVNAVKVFTQNVDDLLERAGCVSVNHVHGFLTWMMCRDEACGHAWDVGYASVAHDAGCPKCGAKHTKPAVVFFGEIAPGYGYLHSTFRASREDLIIVIGTSGEVVSLNLVCGNRRSTHKSTTVLNNLEHDKYGIINYTLFDHLLFGKATEKWSRIREIADAFMSK